jgi:broad specificity phosphatase PhoE
MGQIYLVRHGQASFGTADYDQLSDLGVEQARLLGEWFIHCKQSFNRVVTGDLKRHRQTAQACIGMLPKTSHDENAWETDAGFNEYDHDEVLIRHRPDFADPEAIKQFLSTNENSKRAFQQIFQESMARWMSGAYDADYREPWPVFQQRCIAALERVLDNAGQSQSIIVFTSGGTIATLCQHLLGLSDRHTAELNWSLVNSAVTKLFYQSDRVSLSYLNNFSHLERLGAKHAVTYR